MSRDENLFEGISIMSPQDLEKTISEEEVSETTDGDNDSQETEDTSDELVVAPIDNNNSKEDLEESNDSILKAPSETTEETTSDEPAPNMYAAIIKDMVKDGILSAGEEEELDELLKDANADTIKQLMTGTVENAFKAKEANWKNNFSGAKKKFLEIEDAFTDADQAIQAAQRLEFFENVTSEDIAEDVNLQKNIYYDYLKSKGFSDNDAAEAIEEAEAIDKLAEKATKFLPQLKKGANDIVEYARQQKSAEQQAIAERNKEVFNNLMKTVDEKESFIPGLNLNKVSREKLKNNITAPVYTDKEGRQYTSLMYKQMRNPGEFEMLINYYDSLGLFNLTKEGAFKPDISKLKNVAKTAAVSEIDKVIAANNERGVGRATSTNSSEKTQGILDFLERATNKGGRKRK